MSSFSSFRRGRFWLRFRLRRVNVLGASGIDQGGGCIAVEVILPGDKKTLVSAIANIVLRGKNEKGSEKNPFKVGTIYYKREPTDGILRFISRTAQMGLLETLVPRNISGGKLPD